MINTDRRRRGRPDRGPATADQHHRQRVLADRRRALRGRQRGRHRRPRQRHAAPERRPRPRVDQAPGRRSSSAAPRCSRSAATRPSRSAPATGFRMQTFAVTGFDDRPADGDAAPAPTPAPAPVRCRPPTSCAPATACRRSTSATDDRRRLQRPQRHRHRDETSILDDGQEFEILVNGAVAGDRQRQADARSPARPTPLHVHAARCPRRRPRDRPLHRRQLLRQLRRDPARA